MAVEYEVGRLRDVLLGKGSARTAVLTFSRQKLFATWSASPAAVQLDVEGSADAGVDGGDDVGAGVVVLPGPAIAVEVEGVMVLKGWLEETDAHPVSGERLKDGGRRSPLGAELLEGLVVEGVPQCAADARVGAHGVGVPVVDRLAVLEGGHRVVGEDGELPEGGVAVLVRPAGHDRARNRIVVAIVDVGAGAGMYQLAGLGVVEAGALRFDDQATPQAVGRVVAVRIRRRLELLAGHGENLDPTGLLSHEEMAETVIRLDEVGQPLKG